jgi:hypothetical protein
MPAVASSIEMTSFFIMSSTLFGALSKRQLLDERLVIALHSDNWINLELIIPKNGIIIMPT